KMGTERHKELSNYRAGVEGVPSVLKRAYQLDNLPVRGQVRSKIWIYASIIAQNFKRCTKRLRKLAPATVSGGWRHLTKKKLTLKEVIIMIFIRRNVE